MKLLLGLLPMMLGGGLAFAPPPGDPLRGAYLVSSQRLPCLYTRLAAERGESVPREQLEECAGRWRDSKAAVLLAQLPALETTSGVATPGVATRGVATPFTPAGAAAGLPP